MLKLVEFSANFVMSVFLKACEDSTYRIELGDEPEYCQSLAMNPEQIEPDLPEGSWLINLVAVWSAPDIASIEQSLAAVKMLNGRVKLGIRPFDKHEETARWATVKEKWGSPIRLTFRDGKMLEEKVGLLSDNELFEMVRRAL
jgi:hypothetical protein